MRILWVGHFLPFPATGHGALQRTHHLVRQVAREFDVTLIALTNNVAAEGDIRAMGVKKCRLFQARGGWWRTPAVFRSGLGARSYWEYLFDVKAMREAVVEEAQRPGTIVLLDTIFLAPYGCEVDAPVVVTHHNVESELLMQRAGAHTGLRRWFFSRQADRVRVRESEFGSSAALNLVVSGDDAARLRRFAPTASISVIPNGVDVDFFRSQGVRKRTPFSMVFAGGMDWYPNRDAIEWLATEIWPCLVADQPERTLTVIGKAPPQAIVDLAARDSRVKVLGFVPDVRPYIEQADAYICPIRIGGGTRLKVLDALAMGCPLVATSLSVDGLGLHRGLHYLQADTPDAFSLALRRLDSERILHDELAEAARKEVESRFSWDVIGERLRATLSAL